MKTKLNSYQTWSGRVAATAIALLACGAQAGGRPDAQSWLDNLISPVANPIYFEDPRVFNELRPIYMYHTLPSTFRFDGGSVDLDGNVQVVALQARLALTDRLALIATKDGYIWTNPDDTLDNESGWADIAAGFKYVLLDDRKNRFILTPGFTFTIPVGCEKVFQGNGSGEWNVFVSAAKGFESAENLHVMANTGFRIPNNFDDQTAQWHYSLQLDYFVCDWFIPFVVMNGYTILSDGDNELLGAVPLNTELYDLGNFGSTEAKGTTQMAAGGGFRSKLTKNLDFGIAYEWAVITPKGIFDTRLTTDLSIHW
ncbi:MAG TPA: transporter [Verrucomicrobiota bacterium]|nr:transporter [Verrucomicrobiota bacterium]